jgi:hypothetical protein
VGTCSRTVFQISLAISIQVAISFNLYVEAFCKVFNVDGFLKKIPAEINEEHAVEERHACRYRNFGSRTYYKKIKNRF